MCNESNDIKKPLSKKNPYYIPKHQYFELRHLCLQYADWIKTGYELKNNIVTKYISHNKRLIDDALDLAGGDLRTFLYKGVVENRSYVYLRTYLDIPCCKDVYYRMYRRFFYELSILKMTNL